MRKAAKVSIIVMLFGLSWMAYNFLVANPAHQQKMQQYDQALATCDQKTKLLDAASVALDNGDEARSHQLQLQADNIHCGTTGAASSSPSSPAGANNTVIINGHPMNAITGKYT